MLIRHVGPRREPAGVATAIVDVLSLGLLHQGLRFARIGQCEELLRPAEHPTGDLGQKRRFVKGSIEGDGTVGCVLSGQSQQILLGLRFECPAADGACRVAGALNRVETQIAQHRDQRAGHACNEQEQFFLQAVFHVTHID